jgi:hypothetical protein
VFTHSYNKLFAGVVVIMSVKGSCSFLARRGSKGTSDPNSFTTLISTQLLLDDVKILKNCGASDK